MDLTNLLGKDLCFLCMRYTYFGTVESVQGKLITLHPAVVIEETADVTNLIPKEWDLLPKEEITLNIDATESFWKTNWDLEELLKGQKDKAEK